MRIVSNACHKKAVLLQRNFTGESPDTAIKRLAPAIIYERADHTWSA